MHSQINFLHKFCCINYFETLLFKSLNYDKSNGSLLKLVDFTDDYCDIIILFVPSLPEAAFDSDLNSSKVLTLGLLTTFRDLKPGS